MSYQIYLKSDELVIEFQGDCQHYDVAKVVCQIHLKIENVTVQKVLFVDKGIKTWDSSLLALIYSLIHTYPQKQMITDNLPADIRRLISLALADHRLPQHQEKKSYGYLETMGQFVLDKTASIQRGLLFLKETYQSLKRFFCRKAVFRPVDFWSVLDDCAPKAIGIVSLISLMVGLILAFVGALQLKSFGAQIYISSLVTIGMTRIMGAIMIGIIMAGRTGASYAATIGTMQVNEELDALKTMGISRADFLILPRLLALVMAMPFLVILADFMGMLGGGFVGIFMLDLSPEEYIQFSIDAFNTTDFLVGIVHGIVFGIVISLCGCYFGVKCGRDSGSVGIATTKAVVYSIVWMIVMTGLLTLLCEVLGI